MGPVLIIITILASIVVLFLAFMIVFMIYGIGRNDKHGGFYYDREYVENSDWLPKEHFETIIRGSTWIRDAEAEDIYITRNGKVIAKLTNPFVDRVQLVESLAGIIPQDITPEEARDERLSRI